MSEYYAAEQRQDLRNPAIYLGAAGIVVVFLGFSVVSNGGVPNWPVFIVLLVLALGLAFSAYWLSRRSGPS